MLGASSLLEVELSEPNSIARGNAPCQVQVVVWHVELKGLDNIDISRHELSRSLQSMIYTIEEGVAHQKMSGNGMEGGKASAGSSERASAGLARGVCRALICQHHQPSGFAALSIATSEVLRPLAGRST